MEDYRSDNDSDRSDTSEQNDEMSVQGIIHLIDRELGKYEAEYDYNDTVAIYGLDYTDLVMKNNEDTIEEVVEELIKYYADGQDEYFSAIKQFLNETQINIKVMDIEAALSVAVSNGNEEHVQFFLQQGANPEDEIYKAIRNDSKFDLQMLEAESEEDYVLFAAQEGSLKVLAYFLEKDFSCYNYVFLEAIKTSNIGLVELVCDHAELDQVYDLIKYLIEQGGRSLLPVLFDSFEIKDLLTEVKNQDASQDLFEFILHEAKSYLLTIKQCDKQSKVALHRIFSEFEELLENDSCPLVYPPDRFNGSEKLKKIRDELIHKKYIPVENKSAANLIGTKLCTANQFFTSTPHHLDDPIKSEKYFRSAQHPLSTLVKAENARYQPDPSLPEMKAKKDMGNAAHLGLYRTPLQNLALAHRVEVEKNVIDKITSDGNGILYNNILNYKATICGYIEQNFKVAVRDSANSSIIVGFYHRYPCLMVFIKEARVMGKPTITALSKWTEIIISYFVGLVYYKAHELGLDIELIRRSGFGFLIPSITCCDQSFRLSVGVIPLMYAKMLVECLVILNDVLKILNDNCSRLDAKLPENCFTKSTEYRIYMKDRQKPEVRNILDLVWAKVDKGGKTGAYNLMRTSAARDGFSAEVYNNLSTHIVKKTKEYTQIFLNALKLSFSKIRIQGDKLTFISSGETIFNRINYNSVLVDDEIFFELIIKICRAIQAEFKFSGVSIISVIEAMRETLAGIQKCIKNTTVDSLYYNLEMANELLFTQVLSTTKCVNEDDFGSDSEVEDEIPGGQLYAKKIIVQNGMRAILASLHAGANYLFPGYLNSTKKNGIFLHGAYYETIAATLLLAKFEQERELARIACTNIMIYDANACITQGKALTVPQQNHLSHIRILIIDSTSATLEEYYYWVKEFKKAKMDVLFFVSSGFKNEQMGADKNPYGTIRLFTKDKKLQNTFIDFIKKNRIAYSI